MSVERGAPHSLNNVGQADDLFWYYEDGVEALRTNL